MRQVELHHGSATDVGRVREVNQDAYLASPPVFVVADGMGGDVASTIVVEEFGRLADDGYDPRHGVEAVAATLEACRLRIEAYGDARRAGGASDFGAGTTAVVALLVEEADEPRWLLANLGDSRAYRLHDGALEQVSVDHSVVQELLAAGTLTPADAARHPDRHVVTRALGTREIVGPARVDADFFTLPLPAAERLLLCSDGVSGMVDDATIEAILGATPDPRDAADRVVAAAVAAGGEDNATAVVVDVMGLVTEASYDSARQRESLEQKLGALP